MKRYALALLIMLMMLASFLFWPSIDLTVSGWFYEPNQRFFLAEHPFFLSLHNLAYYGARVLGAVCAAAALVALLRQKKTLWSIDGKGWLFLFIALIVGPVLIANVALKDHWGRARPREVKEFGGSAAFSSAWIPQQNAHANDSFIAGDAAFGFYLSSFAFVIPLQRRDEGKNLSRIVFWSGVGSGVLFGIARVVMGAHFLSDVLFAAFFMLLSNTVLHMALYGFRGTAIYWRNWFFRQSNKQVMLG